MKYITKIIRLFVLSLLVSAFLFPSVDAIAKGRSSSKGFYRYKKAKAIDGDTFKYRSKSYRIYGIDTPEIGQSGWKKATTKLQSKLDSGSYRWKPVAKDVYGRTIVKPNKEIKDK